MKRQLSWTAIILLCGIAAISLGLAADDRLSGQALTVASDPEVDSGMYIFRLELDNGLRAEYSECSGLGSSHDIVEEVITDDSGLPEIRKTPGALRWHEITLRRSGPSQDLPGPNDESVWDWRRALETGDTDSAYQDGSIVMYWTGLPSQILAGWNFRGGWVASLNLNRSVEELTIAHAGLERGDVRPGRP